MNPAQSRSSSVVFPVPVAPMTTWWERIRSYGRLATGPARWFTVLITAPATTEP